MKNSKIILAFALGCLVTLAIGRLVVHVRAQGDDQGGNIHLCADKDGVMRLTAPTATCPNGQRSLVLKKASSDAQVDEPKENPDEKKLEDINRRLQKLENMGCAGLAKRITAPFEVVDREGKRVFYVDKNAAGVFNSTGKLSTWMVANPEGGLFVAQSEKSTVYFGINEAVTTGFGIKENGQLRVALGRNPDAGTYSLRFVNASGQSIAGIGESFDTKAGLALIYDQSGNRKASIGVTPDGKGSVEVFGGNKKAISQLTEGSHNGGRLLVYSSDGTVMVEGGDAGGYGIVRAGPMGFNPGVGLLGLPGSFIMGKQQ